MAEELLAPLASQASVHKGGQQTGGSRIIAARMFVDLLVLQVGRHIGGCKRGGAARMIVYRVV